MLPAAKHHEFDDETGKFAKRGRLKTSIDYIQLRYFIIRWRMRLLSLASADMILLVFMPRICADL